MSEVIKWDGVTPISEPGQYVMTEDQYHADPCVTPSLSSSMIKLMDKSPLHGWFAHPRLNPQTEEQHDQKFDLGNAFHKLILEQGRDLVPIDAKDWRTKAAKEARQLAYDQGLTPLLQSQLDNAQAMVGSVKHQMKFWPDLNRAMSGGVPERVYIWIEDTPHGPVMCRAMIDWTPHGGPYTPDWKSTGKTAGPADWGKILFETGADIQAAWYPRALKAVLDRETEILFAVAEVEAPHALCCHQPDPAAMQIARRKVQWGINTFALCLKRNRWPGYPNQIAWQAMPPWQEEKWLSKEDSGATDTEFTQRMLDEIERVEKDGGPATLGLDDETAADFDREGTD